MDSSIVIFLFVVLFPVSEQAGVCWKFRDWDPVSEAAELMNETAELVSLSICVLLQMAVCIQPGLSKCVTLWPI